MALERHCEGWRGWGGAGRTRDCYAFGGDDDAANGYGGGCTVRLLYCMGECLETGRWELETATTVLVGLAGGILVRQGTYT